MGVLVYAHVVPALEVGAGRYPWLHSKFRVSLGFIRPCPKQNKNPKQQTKFSLQGYVLGTLAAGDFLLDVPSTCLRYLAEAHVASRSHSQVQTCPRQWGEKTSERANRSSKLCQHNVSSRAKEPL